MEKELIYRLLRQPPTTFVDLLMTVKGLKTGSEIMRRERDPDLEQIIKDLGLVFRRKDGLYVIARSYGDMERQGTDSVSRGRWFGIPEDCIQNYQGKDKEELRKRLSLEELKLLEKGGMIPDEFYLGSMGYIPHSIQCEATLERGIKARAMLEGIDPRLWTKFQNFLIRRRLTEYGGEIESWRRAK